MRKFRGLTKEGKWVEGWYIQCDDKSYIVVEDCYSSAFNRYDVGIGFEQLTEVIPETVGQFTDLYDSTKWEQLTPEEQRQWLSSGKTKEQWSGRKIYEGMRVLYLGKEWTVIWVQKACAYFIEKDNGFHRRLVCQLMNEIEVIENPELLERKDQ